MADIKKICKECKKEFVLTEENCKWFESNNLHQPERCEDCRKKIREARRNGGR